MPRTKQQVPPSYDHPIDLDGHIYVEDVPATFDTMSHPDDSEGMSLRLVYAYLGKFRVTRQQLVWTFGEQPINNAEEWACAKFLEEWYAGDFYDE